MLNRYDIENLSDETFETACNGIFSEPPVDILYREEFPMKEGSRVFSAEFLPDNLIREPIQQYSVYSLSKKMRHQ